ncbi:hypothetical protein AiwAL_01025 [Acidiphilium sp. AL]|uniref:hypothetical protein n=1 Tax=Acidiphilium sp. AL TaxID=2871704 RepID=UPI0021CAF11E|nr:hypothetical protein [Acidiphilium sp. AL]MCU4158688.1 hypothetical protein [Acidiphilium sp. AL]
MKYSIRNKILYAGLPLALMGTYCDFGYQKNHHISTNHVPPLVTSATVAVSGSVSPQTITTNTITGDHYIGQAQSSLNDLYGLNFGRK